MWSMGKLRKENVLEDFSVVTEATHWSGVHEGEVNPDLLLEYPVPMVDIEVGSEMESWFIKGPSHLGLVLIHYTNLNNTIFLVLSHHHRIS